MTVVTAIPVEPSLDVELRRVFRRIAPGRPAELFITTLQAGGSAAAALRRAGAPDGVAEAVEQAKSSDLLSTLQSLASVLERDRARQQMLKGASIYPFLLALISVLLGGIVLLVMEPAIGWAGTSPLEQPVPLSGGPAALAIAICTTLLIYVGSALLAKSPAFPFRRAREQHDRALVLGAASALASQGVSLVAAVQGAANMARSPVIRADCLKLAEALERGFPQGTGTVLLGTLGSGLFAAAASSGAGPASLAALAELHESTATTQLPGLLLRAEITSLVLGGIAVASAGAALFLAYAGAFGRA